MYKYVMPILMLLTSAATAHTGAPHTNAHSSIGAKKLLVDMNSPLFYSGCSYTVTNRRPVEVINNCGYTPRKNPKRGSRIELEHIVTASRMGSVLPCWIKGGRRLCNKDKHFKAMSYDLYNLVLSIGELNGDRSNRRYGMLKNHTERYGVDFYISFIEDLIQPQPSVRGDIARIYYYMRYKYDVILTTREEILFAKWHYEDPVDDNERQRNLNIRTLQGNINPFVQ